MQWLPESARFHVASGQTDKALATVEQIARDNQRSMLLGRLVVDGPSGSRGSIRALLSTTLRRTTLLLWFIWMACAFCYYGLVLMSTELFGGSGGSSSSRVGAATLFGAGTEDAIEAAAAAGAAVVDDCRPLLTTDYMDLLWTTLAEFPGIFATIGIIERCGRKKTMAIQFLLFAVCVMMLTTTEE